MFIKKSKEKNLLFLTWLLVPMLGVLFFSSYLVHFGLSDINFFGLTGIKSSVIQRLGKIVDKTKVGEKEISRYLVERPIFPKTSLKEGGFVTLWFDDGWLSQYENAGPILEEAGIRGTIAIVTDYPNYGGYANWDQLRDLQKRGWEITSHGVTHNCSLDQDSQFLEYEMKKSKEVLFSEGLGNEHYVTPCGVESELAIEIAKKYYRSFRSANEGVNSLPVKNWFNLKAVAIDNSFSFERFAELFKLTRKNNLWLILMFHQVDNEKNNLSFSPENLAKVIEMIKDHRLNVVVPTQVWEAQE